MRLKRAKTDFPALEWLGDATGANARITLVGAQKAMIENHTGIVEFTAVRIRLSTRGGLLILEGENLILTQIRPDALTVRGRIVSVTLPPDAKEDDHA